MSLFDELKRRKVFKVGAAYLVVAWLVVQMASIGFPTFDAPPWALRIFILVVFLGFPIALVFAWAFDFTPDGLRPEGGARGDKRFLLFAAALATLAFAWYFKGQPSYRERVEAPAPIAARAAAGSAAAPPAPPAPVSAKSIAVLPFTDLSPGKDQEYFSDGISEEILNALAQVQDLKVAGRTSSFHFKGKNDDLRGVGRALGVAHILEGSVRKQGDKVRITAQLIHTEDGFHLWSESYDGDMSDVFELQERIARSIAASLKVILDGASQSQLAPRTTDNVEAYQQYLRGRYFLYKRGYKNLTSAADALERATRLDPTYVDAWGALAQTYALIGEYSANDPESSQRVDTYPQALAAAEQALRLDAKASAALLARAYVRYLNEFDWSGAELDFRASIASNPRDSTAHQWYGQFFASQGRWREAAAELDRAVALDPLAQIIVYNRGLLQDSQGDFEGALPYLDETLKLSPGFYLAGMSKMVDLVELGRFEQARALVPELPEHRRQAVTSLIAAIEDKSRTEAALKQLSAQPLGGLDQAWALAKLGKRELALAELERLFRTRDPVRVYVLQTYAFRPLYPDPRFRALVRQLRLPESTLDRLTAGP